MGLGQWKNLCLGPSGWSAYIAGGYMLMDRGDRRPARPPNEISFKDTGMKLTDDNKVVHGLWVGNSLSPLELLTIASFLRHGHSFHLWTYDEIVTPLPAGVILEDATLIIPRDRVFRYLHVSNFGHGRGSFAGFSDIFRYKLLYERGGWWVDMDVCCLRPLDFAAEYVFRTHNSLKLVGNIMKCPAGSELMKRSYEQASAEIDEHNRDWHRPIDILISNVEDLGLEDRIVMLSNSDTWNEVYWLLVRNTPPPSQWYAIHWMNEEFGRKAFSKGCFAPGSTIERLMKENNVQIGRMSVREALRIKTQFYQDGFRHKLRKIIPRQMVLWIKKLLVTVKRTEGI